MPHKKLRTGLLLIYLIALHAALVAALFWPDGVWRRLHLIWPMQPAESVSPFRAGTRAMQRAIDFSARPGAIWFFGDSIVQQMDTGRVTPRTINLGIGEDTINGVLNRIGDHPALPAAGGIVVAVGINDMRFHAPEDAARSYGQLLARLPSAIPIVVSAVLPVDERASRFQLAGWNARIHSLNTAIAELCAARPGCTFADAGPAVADATGNLGRSMHVGDGVHLSKDGYDRLIDVLRQAINQRMPADGG